MTHGPSRQELTKSVFALAMAAWVTVSPGSAGEIARGRETDLPLPRFVSMKAIKGNVRRGPSLSQRIDWVYLRKDVPLVVTAEYEHWRRVEDRDGHGGWMHYSLLSGLRTVLVESEAALMRRLPDADARVVAILKRGVVARIDECTSAWCWVYKNGYEGWMAKAGLWGVKSGEIIE